MSAINIPEMIEIVRANGLRPVLVDVAIGTLAPVPSDVERLVSSSRPCFTYRPHLRCCCRFVSL